MSERTKIVFAQYPVRNLPEDMRRGLDSDSLARVTIEADTEGEPVSLRSFIGSAPGVYLSPEDAVAAIRKLRDECE